jgi:peptidoglycan/xylan/chitin deacetylase (PgdA/CDA1 family)
VREEPNDAQAHAMRGYATQDEMPLAVLTYHSMRVHGNEARDNDLVAFSEDVRRLARGGWRVVPLRAAIDDWLLGRGPPDSRQVALTCDDGCDFDFHDLHHPTWGPQRSLLNRARDAAAEGVPAHVTTFAIVSPAARESLDRTRMIGRGWWNEDWWREAAASGLMHVASHSWDHNHEALPEALALTPSRGTFTTIDNERLADLEIRVAQDYLRRVAPNPGDALFAYPYGKGNRYLVETYLPAKGAGMGLVAAFADAPGLVTASCNRWNLPRYVHGRDWETSAQLEALLDRADG